MKLQAATRLQVTAAKGDAKAFREALLSVGKQIGEASDRAHFGNGKESKSLMKAVLQEVDKGFKAALDGKAKVKRSSINLNQELGGCVWSVEAGPEEAPYRASFEFNFGEESRFVGVVWLNLSPKREIDYYEFGLGNFNPAKYAAFVNKAVNEFEKRGFA
jgi:hypothetical protein